MQALHVDTKVHTSDGLSVQLWHMAVPVRTVCRVHEADPSVGVDVPMFPLYSSAKSNPLGAGRGVSGPGAAEILCSDVPVPTLPHLQDHAAVVAGLLQLLETDPSLSLEKAIKTCMEQAVEDGAEVSMHRIADVGITTSRELMRQQRPQRQDVHRAELSMRLLSVFADMKPSVCCGQLEALMNIRTCVLRVNKVGGTQGVLLQNALVKIIVRMACDKECRTEVRFFLSTSIQTLLHICRIMCTTFSHVRFRYLCCFGRSMVRVDKQHSWFL
jgi:hypothetical protein